MAEKKKTRVGILQRKVNGAIKPDVEAEGTENNEQVPVSTPTERARPATSQAKKLRPNQTGSIKVPYEVKTDLTVVKNIEKLKFDYETIQFLIDSYVNTLSPQDQRRYTMLRENMQ